MVAYYNDNDPFVADWLRNLIAAGHIAPGVVDERSIKDVKPDDLKGYAQCHFFAGIGGWSYALRLAGWPDERAVWTGSCPCQPFSAAGKRKGTSDDRHLWPEFQRLIGECNPPVVFGEQVASKDGIVWFDGIAKDLEATGYAVGAVVLPAISVGAPHQRDRLYFVADTSRADTRGWLSDLRGASSVQCVARPWAYSNWQGGSYRPDVLDDGLSARVVKGIAGGYGNAIVPQVAAEMISAYMEYEVSPAGTRVRNRGGNDG